MEQFEANPFQYGRPIADPAGFFGREADLRRLGSLLRQLNWVSIVGPRRIGKTSLLLQLCHPHVAIEMGLGASEYAITYIDCSGLSGLDARGWHSLLISQVAEAIGVSPAPEVQNGFSFRQALRQLLVGKQKLILILDEFESLANSPRVDTDFFNGLRSLSTGYPVAFVTASRSPLIALTYQDKSMLASPFFNVFATARVGLLDEASAGILISRPGADFTEETAQFLLRLAGPNPYFLQIAGYYAFEHQKAGRLDQAGQEQVRHAVEEAVEPHLIYTWQHLSEQARYALVTLPLAHHGEAGLDELHEACLVKDREYLSPLVERFVRRQAIPDILQVRGLWIDLRRRQAVWRRQPLSLSDLAYRLLCYFLRNSDRPIPWSQLEVDVWGETEGLPSDYTGNPERVDARVDALRRVLRETGIGNPISFRGGNYIFEATLIDPSP